MERVSQKKVEAIEALKRDCELYFESNHCFIKGFGWFVPRWIPEERIGVIILKRRKSEIVESHIRTNTSPLTPFGRKWISTPDMENTLVAPPTTRIGYRYACVVKSLWNYGRRHVANYLKKEIQDPKWLTRYEMKCLNWYVDETQAKAEAFKQEFPNIKYYEVDIADLNSMESVQKMLSYFGQESEASLKQVVGVPANLKVGVRHP